MSEIPEDRDQTQAALDEVEEQDDEARLESLEKLHDSLEATLERDDPRAESPTES
jgi:hypothetical protein